LSSWTMSACAPQTEAPAKAEAPRGRR